MASAFVHASALPSPDAAICRQTWEVAASPNPGTNNYLYGSSGLSTTDAWAVGAKDAEPLALHWDGLTWTEIAPPSPGPGTASFAAVTAIASNDVWAVGSHFSGGAFNTLVEHWDGVQWSVVTSPPVQSSVTALNDVWAVSSTDVWAVGQYADPNWKTLALHWNGVQWSIVPSPNRGGANGDLLRAVTGTSAIDVWAVGLTDFGVEADGLILHWDGSAWEIVPQAPAENDSLSGAFALSPNRVWAVGQGGFFPDEGPLVERWDGSSWSLVPSPDPSGNFSVLADVTAPSVSRAWAVGSSSVFSGNRAFLQAWQRQRWRFQAIPHVTSDDILTSVTAASGPQVWAVGWHDIASGQHQTLVLDFC
jgi:hypothetical protein